MSLIKQLVRPILERPFNREWSLQGFGMLRTYLDNDRIWRLHIWTHDHAVDNVSTIHTHPWDFKSTIIAGEVKNQRFKRLNNPRPDAPFVKRYQEQLIKCGPGGCAISSPEPVALFAFGEERYREGASYQQKAEEIHRSMPQDGTVTIIERVFGSNVDDAYVFFPDGEEWVSAEPRDATRQEIKDITEKALERHF